MRVRDNIGDHKGDHRAMSQSAFDVAVALFAAIESGRGADVAALYADHIAVWHNFDDREQTKTENLKTLEGFVASTTSRRYEVIERLLLPDLRVLQRHDLVVRTHGGREGVVPACIILTIRDGLITRIDEYLDTGQVNALFGTGRGSSAAG
jgi:ketosteroid isomerase-like protein